MSRIHAFAGHGPDSEAPPTDEEIEDHDLLLMADVVSKHMGPGPHPSGSPQSVHSGRGALLVKPPPVADPPEREEVYHDGKHTSIMIGGARSEDDDTIVINALTEVERAYPGFLPKQLEVMFTDQKHGGAGAWVDALMDDIVWVNVDYWADLQHISSNWKGHELAIAKLSLDIDTLKEGILFHEFVHTGMFGAWGRQFFPPDLPYYAKPWYNSFVPSEDPSLPSMYAPMNKWEYFAEALTDAHYNGENAAPLSLRTARWVKQVWLRNPDITRFAEVAKHAGPGPHPSGSPQSVHAGGTWATPATSGKAKPKGELITDSLLWDKSILFEGGRSEYDQKHIIKTVTEFRETFPGVLPPVPRFIFLTKAQMIADFADVPSTVTAFVQPWDQPSTVYIVKDEWDEEIDLSNYAKEEGVAFRKAKLHTGAAAQDAYREAVVFHELAHVGMAINGWEENLDLPRYSAAFYPEQISGKDPSLPSIYATNNFPEYFAEALSDYHLRKEKAAPLSIETRNWVMEALDGWGTDEWEGPTGGWDPR